MSAQEKYMERNLKDINSLVAQQLKDYEERGLFDDAINPRSKLHLDTTKLAYHKERVDAWLAGKRIAPITIDMALTQKCSYACTFCYAGLQQNPSSPTSWESFEQFLNDCTEIGHRDGEGVKAISLVSDGESTENPHFYKFIKKARDNGIEVAVGTNGLKIEKGKIGSLVNSLTYIRFNINAAEVDAYAEIMGTSKKRYYAVLDNIREFVRAKKEQGSNITIGLQMVLLPEYADQVLPLSLLGRKLGVDYTVIKHCSDDENGRLGVDYEWYRTEFAQHLLKKAEALSTTDYSVQAKWSKIRTGRDRKYKRCFGTPLLLQMSGSGIVAPCGSFFHKRYARFHIGDISQKRFKDIWASSEYKEVMDHLASDKFDASRQCATLCLQDKVNEALSGLVEKEVALPDVYNGITPMHVNFI